MFKICTIEPCYAMCVSICLSVCVFVCLFIYMRFHSESMESGAPKYVKLLKILFKFAKKNNKVGKMNLTKTVAKWCVLLRVYKKLCML